MKHLMNNFFINTPAELKAHRVKSFSGKDSINGKDNPIPMVQQPDRRGN